MARRGRHRRSNAMVGVRSSKAGRRRKAYRTRYTGRYRRGESNYSSLKSRFNALKRLYGKTKRMRSYGSPRGGGASIVRQAIIEAEIVKKQMANADALIQELEAARGEFVTEFKRMAGQAVPAAVVEANLKKIDMGLALNMTPKELIGAFPPRSKAAGFVANWVGAEGAAFDNLTELLTTYGAARLKYMLSKGANVADSGFASVTLDPVKTTGNAYLPDAGWIGGQLAHLQVPNTGPQTAAALAQALQQAQNGGEILVQ